MIYSIVPTDVVFFDNTQIRQRHLKMYNNVTLELTDGRVERIISTNPQDYLKFTRFKQYLEKKSCKTLSYGV